MHLIDLLVCIKIGRSVMHTFHFQVIRLGYVEEVVAVGDFEGMRIALLI
jgi:hypothetical protein